MSELQCVGASRVEIRYDYINPERIVFTFYRGQFERPKTASIITQNGGTLTYEWQEDISRRAYMKIGTYISGSYNPPRGDCGGTRYFLCNGIYEDAKDKELELSRGEVPLLGVYSGANGITEGFKNARATTQEVYESWIANGVGYEGSSDWARLLKVSECLSDNSIQYYYTRALSANVTHTFRKHYSYWFFVVKENGTEIYRTSYHILGSGENNWDEPDENRATVEYYPKDPKQSFRIYRKEKTETGIEFVTEPRTDGNNGFNIRLLEKYPDTGILENSINPYINTYGGIPAPEVTVTCLGLCPPDTCPVDCGDRICCYGSNGIATYSYLK